MDSHQYTNVSFNFDQQGVYVVLYFVDLTQEDKKRKALKQMMRNPRNKTVMAIAGGDGSMMSMAEEAFKEGLNLTEISICVLPFGTGNDLS